MSSVTSVLIWVSLLEGKEVDGELVVPAIDVLNDMLEKSPGLGGGKYARLKRVDDVAGGTKDIYCYLYAAGINYLMYDEFMACFNNGPWKHPGMNVLLIRPENHDAPSVFRPSPV